MKKNLSHPVTIKWIALLVLFVVLSLCTFTYGQAQDQVGTPVLPNDDVPSTPDPAAPRGAPTQVNSGDRLIYFTPQDSNGTATIINLYNTTDITVTVNVKGMMTGNYPNININVVIPPGSLRRVISDSLDSSAPPSWVNNATYCNFTDSSIYGVLSVPAGVQFDGYIVYNPDILLINPNIDQGALPLRFSADPLNALLPIVNK